MSRLLPGVCAGTSLVVSVFFLLGIVKEWTSVVNRDKMADRDRNEGERRKEETNTQRQIAEQSKERKQRASRPNASNGSARVLCARVYPAVGYSFFVPRTKNGKKDASVVLMILKRRDKGESNGRVQEHDPGILNW